jgi:phosphatidylethanolamine/phosphatidyl-N-methylethanolamine N-methyltransferase
MGDAVARKSLASIIRDEFHFLRGLIGDPVKTGAVTPSGRALAALMASHVDPSDPLPVLELGPGTGVVTKALIERGVAYAAQIVVEARITLAQVTPTDTSVNLTSIRGDVEIPEDDAPNPMAVFDPL